MVSNTELFDLYASLRRAVSLKASSVFKDIGFGTRQFIILWSLHKNTRMTIGELVEAAMTDAATVSRSIVSLIENDYIEKVRCTKDGRVFYVKLTAKGKALAPELDRLYRELAAICFASLKQDEKKQLSALLDKVVQGITLETQMAELEA